MSPSVHPRPLRSACPILTLAVLALLSATTGAADKKDRPLLAKPLAGCTSQLDIPYVPADRLTGNADFDKQMTLNLYVPDDGKPRHPVVLLVHGGGYGGGDKNEGNGLYKPELADVLVKRGYAVVSLNYILTPADIFPQVFWDFRTAVRFLRANAAKWKLDEEKIAAVGFSAGGWLVTGSSWTDADQVMIRHNNKDQSAIGISDLAANKWINPARLYPAEGVVRTSLPLDDPDPPMPDISGRLMAISFDFDSFPERMTAASPPINQWGGVGYKHKMADLARNLGVPYSLSEITTAKPAQGVHVPDLKSPTLTANGTSTIVLSERIAQFLDQQLLTEPRAIAPEIRPNSRVFADRIQVRFITTAGCTVRYTIDGSEPGESSPLYDKDQPPTLTASAVVKAVAYKSGSQPSGVAAAHYFLAPEQVPPRIVAPAGVELPRGKVGQPYSVAFTAEGPGKVRAWNLGGQMGAYTPWQKKDVVFPLGLKLDPSSGVLAGTPDAAGRYWVQIQVAAGVGMLAYVRNYLLVVEP